ncbi:MAG: aldehyde dehydrogenase [Pseudomonadaceae bacterium]|nr:aldehyde dehydrogenase [Pseudomonadaceae bacterium]
MNQIMKAYWLNYVDGQFIDGGSERIAVYEPATGEKLAEQAAANTHDVNCAVKAAKKCHTSGALTKMRPVLRGRMVRRMGDYLLQNIDEIAQVLARESGKPLWEAITEIEGAARFFEYYANQAETVEGKSIPLGEHYLDFTVYEPYGVSAHIIPWNYPIEMIARSLSAALVTGNACVIKTPELTPLSSYYIAKAAEYAGLPNGAVNIICGYGHEAGAALASHPDVNQIVFTGSVPTGIAIASAAAQNVVPCVLELGGKSAAIACSDANIPNLIENVRWGIFFNAGQVCSAMSRLIVHESIYETVVEEILTMAHSLRLELGINTSMSMSTMGAMASAQQRDRALNICRKAQEQGAILVTGGEAPDHGGYYLKPTILMDVTSDMDIAKDEIFGPVLSIFKYETEEQALDIVNNTEYGLVGGIFTENLEHAMHAAKHIKAGQVFINEWYAGGVETPFGGYGKSGYGREKGREALFNYVQTKNIAIKSLRN